MSFINLLPAAAVATGPWSYATIAAAESSGDAWVNDDLITITGLTNLEMKYFSALAAGEHSGLVHRYPFSDANEFTLPVINKDEIAEDPDNWTGFTDTGSGVKGTDYDYTFVSPYSRLETITGNQARLDDSNTPVAADTHVFKIIDVLLVSPQHPLSTCANVFIASYEDGVTEWYTNIRVTKSDNATNWIFDNGSANDSGIAFGTNTRVWQYQKAGKSVIWSDTDATPSFSTTTLVSGALGTHHILWARDNAAGNRIDLGYHLYGRFTEA